MTTTVLALFTDRRNAEGAVRALRDAHFESARLGIVEPGEARVPQFGAAGVTGVLVGAVGCGVVGFAIGLLAGGFFPTIPAWLPGGWSVPFIVAIAGAATGAVAGLLMSRSMAERGALFYDDEVEAGQTLITVNADQADVEHVCRMLLDEGAFDASPIQAPISKAS
jgi:hypothetical protein